MTEDLKQAGLKEHLLSLIPENQRQSLQRYCPGRVEEALSQIVLLRAAAAKALTLDNVEMLFPTEEQIIATLINSGKLALKDIPEEVVFGPLAAATVIRTNINANYYDKGFFCGEGLFNLDLSWSDERIKNGKEARLFEIGFCVNDKGDLIIAKCQRNRLDHDYRGKEHNSSKDLPEKKLGDTYLRKIHEETGLTAEAFGLLATIMLFGDKVPSGDLLVPFSGAQPQIAKRTNLMNHLNKTGYREEEVYNLEKEIARLKPMTDFQAMLEQIGVNKEAIKKEPPFLRVPIRLIKMAMQKRFTDDAKYPDRYLYRGILYGLEEAKKGLDL